jgi:2-polyprenyl-3-methyl-5-hydroxy-6-metoxy-1,4-benzoquinol methylase
LAPAFEGGERHTQVATMRRLIGHAGCWYGFGEQAEREGGLALPLADCILRDSDSMEDSGPDCGRNTEIYQSWSVDGGVYAVLEYYVLMKTIGAVRGLDVLNLACGDGRLSRFLMALGVRSVIGTDISSEMIARASRPERR